MEKKNKQLIITILLGILCVIVILETLFIVKEKIIKGSNEFEEILNIVETPIVDLQYNETMVNNLRVKYNDCTPYEVTFLADIDDKKDIVLFSIVFDGEEGVTLGKIKDKKGNDVAVKLVQNLFTEATLDVTDAQSERLKNVQEDIIDCIVANMTWIENSEETIRDELVDNCIEIDTPYVKLLYPSKWKEYLEIENVETDSYQIKFYCHLPSREKVEIFTYIFDGDSEITVGSLNDIEIGVSLGTMDIDSSWSNEEKDIFYSMQEDMNIIIDGLTYTEGFEMAK